MQVPGNDNCLWRHYTRTVSSKPRHAVPEGNLFREAAISFSELREDISQIEPCQGIRAERDAGYGSLTCGRRIWRVVYGQEDPCHISNLISKKCLLAPIVIAM